MRIRKRVWGGLAGVGLLSGCAQAPQGPQDPVTVDPTHYRVITENAAVRILQIGYPAGAKSVMHHHPDGIAIALTPSKTVFTLPDGTTQESVLAADQAMYVAAGDHNPQNAGAEANSVILVEFKSAAPGTVTIPPSREGQAMTMLAEGPRATAFRVTADPTFMEPEGTTHDYDQVVVALGAAEVDLFIEGKPTKRTWARGDVQFIGRGQAHSAKNLTGAAVDFVLVAIK